MTRHLLFAILGLLLPVVAAAQPFVGNVTPPVFVLPASAVNGGGVFSGQLLAPVTPTDCSAPQYSFTGNTNTGIGYGGANIVAIGAGGAPCRVTVSATAVTSTVPMLLPDGTAAANALQKTGTPGTGVFFSGIDQVSLSISGTQRHTFDASTYYLLSDTARILLGAASDVSVVREAANHLFQRNGVSAQRASWAFRYGGAADYESFSIDAGQTVANVALVGTRTGATGTGKTLRLYAQASNAGAGGGVLELSPSGGLIISATAPTISSGFGTTPSIVASNGTAAFSINVGAGGTANSGVIGLPAATTGWAVQCMNTSTNTATVFLTKQTATTTTTATIGNYDAAGAAAAWVASNVLVCSATAF